MEVLSENARLVQRAYWLIRLRWVAIVIVCASTYFCSEVLGIEFQSRALYGIGALLAGYNICVLWLLRHLDGGEKESPCPKVKKIINFQISADLILLTLLLHFSGGIENPFASYFIFHMIIASILLSVRDSYLQATLAVLLFGLMVLLEYTGLVEHYCLRGFVANCVHRDGLYVLGNFVVFATSVYLTVYMACYVASRLKRAERAQRKANALLREKDRIKDEYVLRVTHDMKGHLAAIQSCLEVVTGGITRPLDAQQAEFVGRAQSRTITLSAFVKALLKLTQMRLSDSLEKECFSLRKAVEGSVEAVQKQATDKSVGLSCSIELAAETVCGNSVSVEELITNLLLNAIKYTPSGGEVSIRVTSADGLAKVTIEDTGIGIPDDEIGRVFDEFYRASNAKKSEQDGTGLGLSIAKHIVERHGGEIGIESTENRGTSIWFTLPATTSEARVSEAALAF